MFIMRKILKVLGIAFALVAVLIAVPVTVNFCKTISWGIVGIGVSLLLALLCFIFSIVCFYVKTYVGGTCAASGMLAFSFLAVYIIDPSISEFLSREDWLNMCLVFFIICFVLLFTMGYDPEEEYD